MVRQTVRSNRAEFGQTKWRTVVLGDVAASLAVHHLDTEVGPRGTTAISPGVMSNTPSSVLIDKPPRCGTISISPSEFSR